MTSVIQSNNMTSSSSGISTQDQIRNAANKNKELLNVLAETDYAPPSLQQQQKYIDDVNHELHQVSTKIQELTRKREQEHKDHEKYRDSTMKRFAYRMGGKSGKFEAKAEKEEREYFDAVHAEHQAKEQEKSLNSSLSEAQSRKSELEGVAQRHKQAQAELDALYDSIFEGPSPDFPEEDAKERTASQALDTYQTLSKHLESERQALQLLSHARNKIAAARSSVESARSHSTMDMLGGGMMFDMMERNALSRAETEMQDVVRLAAQAQRVSPQVQNLPNVSIAGGKMIGDMLFDNPFSDYEFHKKIRDTAEQVDVCARALQGEWTNCGARVDGATKQLGEEGRRLEQARGELQAARERAFESVLGGAQKY